MRQVLRGSRRAAAPAPFRGSAGRPPEQMTGYGNARCGKGIQAPGPGARARFTGPCAAALVMHSACGFTRQTRP